MEIAMSTTITVIVEPLTRRPGYFEARVDGTLLATSRTPLLCAARRLRELGCSPHDKIAMKYIGRDIIALSALIGTAAGLAVSEEDNRPPRFKRWRPRDLGEGAPRIAPDEISEAMDMETVS
jgi:hypothetical protein